MWEKGSLSMTSLSRSAAADSIGTNNSVTGIPGGIVSAGAGAMATPYTPREGKLHAWNCGWAANDALHS